MGKNCDRDGKKLLIKSNSLCFVVSNTNYLQSIIGTLAEAESVTRAGGFKDEMLYRLEELVFGPRDIPAVALPTITTTAAGADAVEDEGDVADRVAEVVDLGTPAVHSVDGTGAIEAEIADVGSEDDYESRAEQIVYAIISKALGYSDENTIGDDGVYRAYAEFARVFGLSVDKLLVTLPVEKWQEAGELFREYLVRYYLPVYIKFNSSEANLSEYDRLEDIRTILEWASLLDDFLQATREEFQ